MGRVLLLGGDGAVGTVVHTILAAAGHDVLVAHHNPVLTDIQHPGVRTLVLDVADLVAYASELHGVDLVINCTGRVDPKLVVGAAEHGADFLDVGAGITLPAAVHGLDADLRAAGTTAVVGVGLAPGLTGLLAAAVASAASGAGPVEITVLLGLGEANGAAGTRWMLDQLKSRPAGRSRGVELPGSFGRRRAVPLDFGDRASLGSRFSTTINSYCVLDPPWVDRLTRVFARLPKRLRSAASPTGGVRLLRRHAWWVVHVTAPSAAAWAMGWNETAATGTVTAWAARQLLAGAWPVGAHDLHALTSLDAVAPCLRRAGIGVALSLPGAHGQASGVGPQPSVC